MQYVVVLLFKLPVGNNKHPNFEWRGGGGGGVWIVLFSEVTPFEDKVSTTLSVNKPNNISTISYAIIV